MNMCKHLHVYMYMYSVLVVLYLHVHGTYTCIQVCHKHVHVCTSIHMYMKTCRIWNLDIVDNGKMNMYIVHVHVPAQIHFSYMRSYTVHVHVLDKLMHSVCIFKDLHMFNTNFYEVKLFLLLLDPTLTPDNVISVMEDVEVWNEFDSSRYLHMPRDTHRALHGRHYSDSGKALKIALIEEYLSHHPYPRWEPLIELVEDMERWGKARARLAQEIKDKYITSKSMTCRVSTHRHC